MLTLSTGGVHLWFVFDCETYDPYLLDRYRQLLTADEREQELRFHFAQDRARYVVTRALVRTVLSRYSSLRPEDWRFEKNYYGRPEIVEEQRRPYPIRFNISHTNALIVLGITLDRALGIDVEDSLSKDAPLGVAHSYFSPKECADLGDLPLRLQQKRFFEYWTLKESYIKAKGKGLSLPLDHFSFRFPNECGIEVSFLPELNDSPQRWRFWLFQPTMSHLVAVCAQRDRLGMQKPTMRKYVPLVVEEPLDCTILRKSD
jgi:4'-phosphopantetheinyl transferase